MQCEGYLLKGDPNVVNKVCTSAGFGFLGCDPREMASTLSVVEVHTHGSITLLVNLALKLCVHLKLRRLHVHPITPVQ